MSRDEGSSGYGDGEGEGAFGMSGGVMLAAGPDTEPS